MKYKFHTRPYKHQVRALRKLISNGYGGALLMDPRTGKTKVAIDYLSMLSQAGKIDRAVIICPNRVMDVWVDQFYQHCPGRFHVVVWDKVERTQRVAGRRVARPISRASAQHDLTLLVVNYEAFAVPGPKTKSGRRSKRAGRFKTRDHLLKWAGQGKAAIVLDESHKIKSPSGKAANMIVGMGSKFSYRVIMTGTPVTKAKRTFDVYMQWKFLNPDRFADLPTVGDFKEHFGRWSNRKGFPEFLGVRNVDELRDRIHRDAYAVRRSECFDLPPREDQVIKVPLVRSARVYDQLAANMVAEIHVMKEMRAEAASTTQMTKRRRLMKEVHTIEASIRLTLTLRLSQITGGCATTDEGKIIRIGSEKISALKPLLENAFECEEKVVAAARFKPDLTACQRVGRELDVPTFRLSGGVSREDGARYIRDFQSLDGPALFVVQPSAGALGIDLSAASRMVWYSLTPSWTDFTQCCDRIALSRTSTTFTHLLAEGTVDEVMYQTLREDGEVHEKIIERPELLLRS